MEQLQAMHHFIRKEVKQFLLSFFREIVWLLRINGPDKKDASYLSKYCQTFWGRPESEIAKVTYHYYHGMRTARISSTHSRHFPLSAITLSRSSRRQQMLAQSCWM